MKRFEEKCMSINHITHTYIYIFCICDVINIFTSVMEVVQEVSLQGALR